MPIINLKFFNTTKPTIEKKFVIHSEHLKDQASNIAERLINANNISDFKFNFLLKKLDKAQQKNIALIDNHIKFFKKKLTDLHNSLKTTTSESKSEIEDIELVINELEKEREKISHEKTLQLKRAADIKRENLEARHPGKIHYDEPITPFILMTYDEALEILDENTWINRNHQKTQSAEMKEDMKPLFDILETCDAELIKQPSQRKGKLKSVSRYSKKTAGGICWGHMMEGIIQKSQGKTLDSSMRFGNQIKASSLNKIIKKQMKFEKQRNKLDLELAKIVNKYQPLKWYYEHGNPQHAGKVNLLQKKIQKLQEKIDKLDTGETYLTKHNFIKIGETKRELSPEDIQSEEAVETFVSSFIGDMTANKEEHQKVYKTIGATDGKLGGHAMSILIEKQGGKEIFTFSDPNHNRSVRIDDKQKFEIFLRKNFSETFFVQLKEVTVTDFIYKDEQS
ncbi:hypothetical protein [Candidatus Williamhamiltonella defendens]|uniref:Peptidase C58 YopT-type domain-containing protein n=1 Tax=Candidatus Williamhamiltonella defendens TaxID=138072 RepID=A0A2D3TEU4_9ENTR|nr:hypothetical protein [Candidatus Hamiltonella defensa]ATW34309.1 hypothetical protein BJP43_08635 [Candidatus Hamiltonella defensa]